MKTGMAAGTLAVLLFAGCYGNAVRTMGKNQIGAGANDAASTEVAAAGDSPCGSGCENDSGVVVDTAGTTGTSCTTTPTAPPTSLGLDSFYAKYLSVGGIPVVASAKVADPALQRACAVTAAMTSTRPDVRRAMVQASIRIAVIATGEALTDLPEYRDLPAAFPQTDWSTYRGIGATLARPVSSTAEENVLCLPSNTSPSESILVYTVARAVALAVSKTFVAFDSNLRSFWLTATNSGLWANTSAATDATEYWALGALAWYDAAAEADPANGLRNQINTRAELRYYDPLLTSVMMQYFPEVDLPVHCP